MPISRVCKTCGRSYSAPPSQKLFFCSIACYNLAKKGAGNPKWRGGNFICDGYRYVYAPHHPNSTKAGYVVEHRLQMESKIGRSLTRKEVVHHIDGNKLNNSIDNLVLCQSTGQHFVTEHLAGRDTKGRFKLTK